MTALALLIALAEPAVAGAPPLPRPGVDALIDCGFRKIDAKRKGVDGPTLPLAMLFNLSGTDGRLIPAADLKVFDPSDLILDHQLIGGFYDGDGTMLFILTDESRPVHFKLVFSYRPATRKWAAAIGMNGSGSAREHLAHSYMGECTIEQPADARARFEAMGAGQ